MNYDELYESYTLPKELSAETKFHFMFLKFSLSMLLSVGVFFFFAYKMQEYIYLPLQIPWYIFNILVGVLLIVKSKNNQRKNILQSFILMLTSDRSFYKPIDVEKKEVEVYIDETPD